jgi:hypothetical protein
MVRLRHGPTVSVTCRSAQRTCVRTRLHGTLEAVRRRRGAKPPGGVPALCRCACPAAILGTPLVAQMPLLLGVALRQLRAQPGGLLARHLAARREVAPEAPLHPGRQRALRPTRSASAMCIRTQEAAGNESESDAA